MIKPVSKRIELIISHYKLNKNSFSKAIGMTNNVTIGRIIDDQRQPSYQVLVKIIQTFGSVNPLWLMTGEGEMLINDVNKNAHTPTLENDLSLPNQDKPTSSPIGKTIKTPILDKNVHPTTSETVHPSVHPTRNLGVPFIITMDNTGRENVVMVPVRARAGYLEGYGDPEFIQTLPTYTLPGLRNGSFRAFEVEGYSMVPTLANHDIVIGDWVESFDDIRDDRIYVIVTRNKGIVVKRVLNRIDQYGFLVCKSDTVTNRSEYPNLQIHPEDILELWYARMYISADLKAPSDMWHRLNNLEGDIEYLKSKL